MQIVKGPDNVWTVRPHGDTEAALIEMLLSALAEKYPDPPLERKIPAEVIRLIHKTNPEVALKVVQRLNLSEGSEASLGTLYAWCRPADLNMAELAVLLDELLAANVIAVKYRVLGPRTGYGLQDFSSREEVPEEMVDDDEELFMVTEDDVMKVYIRNEEAFASSEQDPTR